MARALPVPIATASTLLVWAAAALAPVGIVRTLAAFVAVCVLPGFLLAYVLGKRQGGHHAAGSLGLALALSTSVVGLLGALAAIVGANIAALLAALVGLTVLLAVRQDRRPHRHERVAGAHANETRTAWLLIALLTAAAGVLASIDANIARDRMWYAAWMTTLAGGDPIAWRDPLLASGQTMWRFAANAWLVCLAAWTRLGALPAPSVLERIAPSLLVLFVPSASYCLTRALWPGRRAAAWAVLCTLVVLFASTWPYFSPARHAFFARLVEDKTIALVILAPVALGLTIDRIADRRPTGAGGWILLALSLAAVALTHAIVYLVVLASVLAATLAAAYAGASCWRRTAAVLGVVAVIAVAPATLGLRARATMPRVELHGGQAVAATTHPVVRAHLRLNRLRTLAAGGPVVEPLLLADPVLLTALAGLLPAWRARRRLWGGYLLATTSGALLGAFAPGVAPAIGAVLLPWMAYRVLWGIPFGLLLAVATLGCHGARPSLRIATTLALVAVALASLPWTRLQATPHARLQPDAPTRALLRAIARLPSASHLAAAPALSELIPAYSGRSVLALGDRATVVFVGSRSIAERRMRDNAAIIALARDNPRIALALAQRNGVTHLVLEDARACPPASRTVVANGPLRLCALERATAADVRWPLVALARARRTALRLHDAPVLAAREAGSLQCTPRPARKTRSGSRWLRRARWSGAPVAIDCTARFARPVTPAALALTPWLPRARDALVYRIVGRDDRGKRRCRSIGAVEVEGGAPVAVRLRCTRINKLRVRLVASYLPYISLADVKVRADAEPKR